MSEQATEYVCADCGQEFQMAAHLATHRKFKHGVEPAGRSASSSTTSRPRSRSASVTEIQRQLKDGAMAAAMGLLMATGNVAALAHPGVIDALESRADKFASAWAAAARQDPRVARYLSKLLTGGVWVNAVGQTLAFGVTVGVLSGAMQMPAGAVTYWIPELAQFQVVNVPSPNQNGDGEHDDQSA